MMKTKEKKNNLKSMSVLRLTGFLVGKVLVFMWPTAYFDLHLFQDDIDGNFVGGHWVTTMKLPSKKITLTREFLS